MMQGVNSLQYDLPFYEGLLQHFIETGDCVPEETQDELYAYLQELMQDDWLKIQVLTDQVHARLFYDIMLRYITTHVGRLKFNLMRNSSEQARIGQASTWSYQQKRDGWQVLLAQIDADYNEYGFQARYYDQKFSVEENLRDDDLWSKFLDDWKEALDSKQQQLQLGNLERNRKSAERDLHKAMEVVPEYLKRHQIPEEEFYQAWSTMGGIWNEVELERARKIIAIQKDYPILVKLANRMGRIADEDSNQRLAVASDGSSKMQHSSKSDILGITVGRDLNALLPSELAQYSDVMEDLFLYKYVTGRLQNFSHQSHLLKPSRTLNIQRARPKGPMIVCLDTSGSMVGIPQQIAQSLLVKLLDIADRQQRNLFLIAFSVSALPIDVRKDRSKVLEFFTRHAQGDTNPTAMMRKMLDLLQDNQEYMSADVLWITDFVMRLPAAELLQSVTRHRQQGTKFWGLRIGIHDMDPWLPYFDAVYTIEYKTPRKYGK